MGEILKVIDTAEGWIGAKEGDNKYKEIIDTFESNKTYKYDGQGCCEFVCAVFIKALGLKRAKQLIPIINYANAQAKKWKNGLSDRPQAGGLVYYGDGKEVNHVELITEVHPTGITTVDGNSYHTVVERTRPLRDKSIMGFGNPDFKEDKEYWEMEWKNAVIRSVTIKRYNTGALVLWLQEYLQAHGFYLDGKLDGVFGQYTETAVKQWQRNNGLLEDGIIGEYCFTFMVK